MSKQTWVYLMKDLRSGFYKIGESKTPQYRERTLQSEQPLIELIEAWRAEKTDEAFLHRKFAHKRIRGEWFSLDFVDYYEIYIYFEEHIKFTTGTTCLDDEMKEAKHFRDFLKREHIVSRFIYT
jgi:hypothetical protein